MHITECYGSPVNYPILEYETDQLDNVVQKNSRAGKAVKEWNIKKLFFLLCVICFDDIHVHDASNPSQAVKVTYSEIFLPQGYPDSVSDDYFNYQVWDTLQAFCSSITGTLATQAVLKGSGVGDSTATAAGATITWLLKDGTGMAGRIAFAYVNGTFLDCNAKQWRLFADVLNDGAMFVQLLAPLFPKEYFTPIMCLSGLAFSLVGVAGGCTRAALTMHQAKRDNMADVSAKDGSQETLVNLIALITSLIITPVVSDRPSLTWTLFVIFVLMHVYANYKAVACVVMEVFNRIRLFTTIDWFLSGTNRSLSPANTNQAESLFFPPNYSWLKLGCKIEELKLNSHEFKVQIATHPKYLVEYDRTTGIVYAALAYGATSEDIIRASYCGYLLHQNIASRVTDEDEFIEKLRNAGWDLSKQQLCADEWRWCTDNSFYMMKKAQHKYV